MSLSPGNRRRVLACTLLGALTFVTFAPSLWHDFVNYDDTAYVTENPHVLSGLTWANVTWAFGTGYFGNWHPVTWLSHCADVELFGLRPGWHHLTSLILHTANAVVLFLLLETITSATWRSALVAALFAVHPLHVESVAWVSERKDVLSTFFAFLALGAYVLYVREKDRTSGADPESAPTQNALSAARPPASGHTSQIQNRKSKIKNLFYVLALLLFGLALMSKAMVVTLPFVLLLIDFWPLGRFTESPGGNRGGLPAARRLLLEKVPFLVLAAVSTLIGFALLRDAGAINETPGGIGRRLAQVATAYTAYLGKAVWPRGLATPYPRATDWPVLSTIWAMTLITAMSIGALWVARRRPYLTVGWLWFLGTLAPVIGFVQLGAHGLADRYTYFPLIGLLIALAWGAADCAAHFRLEAGVQGLLGTAAVIACAVAAVFQLAHWRDSERLYRHALEVTRANFMAHNGLGLELFKRRQVDDALHEFETALEINPRYDPAMANLGRALAEKHMYSEAAIQFEGALKLRPDAAAVHNNFGNVLSLQGRHEEAIAHFAEAVRLDPSHAGAQNNLAIASKRLGRTADAVAHYRDAIRLKPDSLEALNNLAWVLAADPDPEFRNGAEALELATRACEMTRYEHPTTLMTLAAAYGETRQFSEAISFAERAKELLGGQGPAAERVDEMLGAFRAAKPYRGE